MSKILLIICLLLFSWCIVTTGYNVLVVFPFPLRSLNIAGEGVVRNLLKAGHKVTYASSFPVLSDFNTENFTHISVDSTRKVFENNPLLNMSFMMEHTMPETDIWIVQHLAIEAALSAFHTEDFQRLLNDTSIQFDAIISSFVETELYSGLSAVYNCPMIWAYSLGAHSVISKLVDQPVNPGYSADYTTGNSLPFTFQERVYQLWFQVRWFFYKLFYTQPREKTIYEQFFVNDHHASGEAPAVPLSFKFLGGYHIEDPPKPLPKNLQTILDNAKDGAIYFSMGSTWKSKDFPKQVKEELLKMFGELKQTVIWKYEEDLPDTPANVHIVNWAPQQSILAHPNVRLLIYQGGHASSIEALHFAVPQIGVPVYYDQNVNIKNAIRRGTALSAKLDVNLANSLRSLIREILTNNSYTERVKELSWIYHHRPQKPGVELVHWVEHVIKSRGARHLRSPALSLSFYQRAFLDLASLILVVLIALVIIVKRCLTMFRNSHTKHRSKKMN
ncbi:hypothetical protein ACJJTC_018470 [Scirpophaga incertulas]